MGHATLNLPLEVIVDPGLMQAWLAVPTGIDLSGLNAQSINVVLEAAEIAVDDGAVARIGEFLKCVAAHRAAGKRFLIAVGTPPVDASDADFQWASQQDDPPPSVSTERFAHRAWCSLRLAGKGAVIGKIIPAVAGRAGLDIRGNEVPPAKVQGRPIEVGEGAVVASDGVTVEAAVPGRVTCDGGCVSIRPFEEAELSTADGPDRVASEQDVVIRGAVCGPIEVSSTASVIVTGPVEAAQIKAEADVILLAGILGKSKAKLVAGRDVVAKFCDDVTIQAGRDMVLGTAATNARMYIRGTLYAAEAAIVGGKTRAGRTIDVRVLGSEGRIDTQVAVAPPWNAVQKARHVKEEIAKRRDEAACIQETIQPLMDNLKSLAPAQKERVTELSFKADTLEAEIAALEREGREEGSEQDEAPFIRVRECIHSGTTLAIGNCTARVDRRIKGPVRVERHELKDGVRLAVVDESAQTVTLLKNS